ncbi:MAG: YihA family ribosome biogenesis GTP-binding protein [Flavobacteriaceae bacterium]|nr:YihA family ribosome biogenesis GTP-binding protein [Flavobacteriaceae bacterium]|tara:strand:+ start:1826 stop:2413 length:588 start_codon:yes stop_codon:yes gene_type:complete
MIIKSSDFIKSSSKSIECPKNDIPEFAFIGRSNVGKSSLINMLTQNKKLAKISGNPGKTLLINHFLINKNWFLVDLPGYGYAKISKKEKKKIENIIIDYFTQRVNISLTFVLIDIRLKPQLIDIEFMNWLSNNNIKFKIIFTKEDKLKLNQKNENASKYINEVFQKLKIYPEFVVSSSKTKKGRNEISNLILSEI